MAHEFYASLSYNAIAPLPDTQAAGLAIVLMDSHILQVAEVDGAVVGMVGLLVEPFLFNPGYTIANEVIWWVDPEARRTGAAQGLLRAVDDETEKRGCAVVRMMTMAESPPQAAALYARHGYYASEHAFTKRLN